MAEAAEVLVDAIGVVVVDMLTDLLMETVQSCSTARRDDAACQVEVVVAGSFGMLEGKASPWKQRKVIGVHGALVPHSRSQGLPRD